MVSDDGRNLLASVRWDATNLFGTEFFLIQLRDTTEHRQLLTASELRFTQLAASLPDAAIFMFDHDLRLQLVLGEAIRANGYDPAAMTGRLLNEAFAQDVVDLLESPYRAALAGHPQDFDYTSPGRGRQFRIRVRPITGPDNEIVGALSVNEDVSVDRARQVQLEQVHRLTAWAAAGSTGAPVGCSTRNCWTCGGSLARTNRCLRSPTLCWRKTGQRPSRSGPPH